MRTMKPPRHAVLLTLALVIAACTTTPTAPEPPRVYIVRHAEKLAGDDPALSVAGEARARRLAEVLADAGITRIYSTDTRRTRATAAPLAAALGLEVEIYDAGRQRSLAALVAGADRTALIVGHSNTIAAMAAAFGVDPGEPVADDEYDRLYVITPGSAAPRVEIRRYGDRLADTAGSH